MPYPPSGHYTAAQTHPVITHIPFRVVGDRLFWGDPEVEFKWDKDRWEQVGNEDHYLYFFDSPTTDEKFFIEHDLSQAPPYTAGGVW